MIERNEKDPYEKDEYEKDEYEKDEYDRSSEGKSEKTPFRAELPDEDDDYEEERLRRRWERQQELKNAQREKRLREQRQKLRALAVLGGVLVAVIMTVAVLTVNVFIPLGRYQSANKLLERGEYAEAIIAFRKMPGYKDADTKLAEAIRLQAVKLAGKEDVYYETSESAPWFTVTEQGELKLIEKEYKGDWGNVVVPDVFDGVLVTALAEKAFAHCEKMTSVTVSDCVLSLGTYAFLECDGLTEVTLPAHLETVGDGAFEDCKNLEAVTFGAEVTHLGANAFAGCKSLGTVLLPDSLREIGSRAFNGCKVLDGVSVGAGLEKIGSYAFSACDALTTLTYRGTEAAWSALSGDLTRAGLDGVTVVFAGKGN